MAAARARREERAPIDAMPEQAVESSSDSAAQGFLIVALMCG
ncbi:MAG: hypothetical protein U0531_13295 [Dehalococcoidia bacterium]